MYGNANRFAFLLASTNIKFLTLWECEPVRIPVLILVCERVNKCRTGMRTGSHSCTTYDVNTYTPTTHTHGIVTQTHMHISFTRTHTTKHKQFTQVVLYKPVPGLNLCGFLVRVTGTDFSPVGRVLEMYH